MHFFSPWPLARRAANRPVRMAKIMLACRLASKAMQFLFERCTIQPRRSGQQDGSETADPGAKSGGQDKGASYGFSIQWKRLKKSRVTRGVAGVMESPKA
jgi:hypothetical protein